MYWMLLMMLYSKIARRFGWRTKSPETGSAEFRLAGIVVVIFVATAAAVAWKVTS